jgi:transcriptional regulator with XRE-family HTH domain
MVYRFAGHLLRAKREANGLTRAELGREAGCTESCITLYELGYREPPTSRLVLLAALLGMHVEQLFVEEVPA